MKLTDTLWLDTETFGELDIKVGTDNYARHSEIMIWTWAMNDDPAKFYDATAGGKFPAELRNALADPTVQVRAHNARFDMTILKHHGYNVPLERWYCTMAQALSHGLPGALEKSRLAMHFAGRL